MDIKRRLIIFIILLFPIISNAQSKWSAGLMLSPDITYATSSDHEKHPIGFEIGFTAYRKLSKSFYFNTGLTIAKRKSKVTYYNSYYNNGEPDSSVVINTSSDWTELNIPLLLNYRLPVAKKLSITSSAGIIFAWDLKNTFSISDGITNYKGSTKGVKGLDKAYLSYGLGGLYNINDKFSLILMPNAMISFINGGYQYSFNLRTTLLYNFK